jgi:hypothetical protein
MVCKPTIGEVTRLKVDCKHLYPPDKPVSGSDPSPCSGFQEKLRSECKDPTHHRRHHLPLHLAAIEWRVF